MAINLSDMQAEFEDFYNEVSPYDWLGIPTNSIIQDKIGTLWQNVMEKGFLSVVPASTTVVTAAQTLGGWLKNNPALDDGGAAFYAQIAAFFNTIMGGMPGHTITTLPIPLVLSAPFSDKSLAALTLATQIKTTAETGVVTNTSTMTPVNLS
jgi:hypothetical protein